MQYASLRDVLDKNAVEHGVDAAFTFLSEDGQPDQSLTFAELSTRASEVASALIDRGGRPGDRAILLFPPGLDFVIGFLGCVVAGVIAVPMLPPRRINNRDSSHNILTDCKPRFALTNRALEARGQIKDHFVAGSLQWLVVDDSVGLDRSIPPEFRPGQQDLALLQYTSGSTSSPKGVMVSHANLLSNLAMIRTALSNTRQSTYVTWMPLHHDMGLIYNILQAFYLGASCILMAPVSFIQRPLKWLAAISKYKAEVAGGPNFGFDLCVSRFRPEAMAEIDLSGWRVALNGAEPVRAETLNRFSQTFSPYGFRPSSFYPCYGMAEATLLISGGRRGQGAVVRDVSKSAMQELKIESPRGPEDSVATVACGKALEGEEIAIVDPQSRTRCSSDLVGEIWVRGPHVAMGYWLNEAATQDTFQAGIVGEPNQKWLRTGDLGYLDASGELFITGRIKDLIIVRGANFYPQDIEFTVQTADARLRAGFCAVFTHLDKNGQERVIVAQEIERSHRRSVDSAGVAELIREAVAEEHQLSVSEVILVAPGGIPKTTSGKIQRQLTKHLWLNGQLERIN